MTPTILTLFGIKHRCRSEKDAYVRALIEFITRKPNLFTDPKFTLYSRGARGAQLFARSPTPLNDPVRLTNGWYASVCLNNAQKVSILDSLARCAGWKRGRDWDWQAENRPTPEFIDTEALKAKLRSAHTDSA
ncbi:MAG: hypothetical protein ACREVO_13265 [Steroidobacteraceae bacterium]